MMLWTMTILAPSMSRNRNRGLCRHDWAVLTVEMNHEWFKECDGGTSRSKRRWLQDAQDLL